MTKRLGLALGSGAARGWAHIGVLRGLKELNLKPDVIAGCSVGALVGGAHLLGALGDLEEWARELKPLSALGSFSFKIGKGGLVDVASTFEAFSEFDRDIETLETKFGAVATDIATGEEVWLTSGSTIEAVRASSSIPVLFHSVAHKNRWMVDGALANPTPTSLARHLGADIVIAVDLTAVPRVLNRFDGPPPSVPAIRDNSSVSALNENSGRIATLIEETRKRIDDQISMIKQRSNASPQLFETAYAAADIFQMQLARARAEIAPPDIMLKPDMRDAFPTAFDKADEFIEEGYRALMEQKHLIEEKIET